MAVGDAVSGSFTITATQNNTIRPSAGVEWVIHNLYYFNTSGASPNIEFSITDGTSNCIFDSDTTRGARLGMCFHVSNTQYLKVNNISAGTTMLVYYDGIQTK